MNILKEKFLSGPESEATNNCTNQAKYETQARISYLRIPIYCQLYPYR